LDLVVSRRDPDAMDIDMMKRQGMCFNCEVKGHITKKGTKILWEENQARKVKEKDVKRGFWKRQEVSTNSPALVDSRI